MKMKKESSSIVLLFIFISALFGSSRQLEFRDKDDSPFPANKITVPETMAVDGSTRLLTDTPIKVKLVWTTNPPPFDKFAYSIIPIPADALILVRTASNEFVIYDAKSNAKLLVRYGNEENVIDVIKTGNYKHCPASDNYAMVTGVSPPFTFKTEVTKDEIMESTKRYGANTFQFLNPEDNVLIPQLAAEAVSRRVATFYDAYYTTWARVVTHVAATSGTESNFCVLNIYSPGGLSYLAAGDSGGEYQLYYINDKEPLKVNTFQSHRIKTKWDPLTSEPEIEVHPPSSLVYKTEFSSNQHTLTFYGITRSHTIEDPIVVTLTRSGFKRKLGIYAATNSAGKTDNNKISYCGNQLYTVGSENVTAILLPTLKEGFSRKPVGTNIPVNLGLSTPKLTLSDDGQHVQLKSGQTYDPKTDKVIRLVYRMEKTAGDFQYCVIEIREPTENLLKSKEALVPKGGYNTTEFKTKTGRCEIATELTGNILEGSAATSDCSSVMWKSSTKVMNEAQDVVIYQQSDITRPDDVKVQTVTVTQGAPSTVRRSMLLITAFALLVVVWERATSFGC